MHLLAHSISRMHFKMHDITPRFSLQVVVLVALAFAWGGLGCAEAVAAGDANSPSCANSQLIGFREFMPDCRGYEMVTPPYKGGAQVLLFAKAIAADGSRMIGVSYGGFVGTENSQQGSLPAGSAVYQLSRSPAGWSVEPLEPSATQFTRSEYVTTSNAVTDTLWQVSEDSATPLAGGTVHLGLAVRVHEPGSAPRFESIGPENPSSWPGYGEHFRFEAASNDLSHVVYGIEAGKGATWPGDEIIEGRSLYEYSGVGNSEPSLVAVRNQEALKGAPNVNEGAELIGKCGADVGAPSLASAYNAISSVGSTLYFTVNECAGAPAVNELYARVDGERTVAISEPSHPLAQGAGPGAEECASKCEAAVPRPAEFQGASEDGRIVFFTTAQSLLNGDEAGEGSGVDLYETELEAGELKRLTQVSHDPNGAEEAEVQGVARIAETGRRVYYVARGVLSGANAEGFSATQGMDNLYVYDTTTHATSFVATLAAGDRADWKENDNRPVQASRDGRFLVFPSKEHLTGSEDTSTVAQLFEYDAQTGRLSRVSVGQQSLAGYVCPATGLPQAGYNCNGNTRNPRQEPTIPIPLFSGGDTPTEANSTLAITEDGRVFFMSRDALTPLALEESKNIYEYSGGKVYLIAAGDDPQMEYGAFNEGVDEGGRLVSTDASGNDLFFGAVGQLLPADTDTQADVYDARVEGGSPPAVAPVGCEGGSCRAGSLVPSLLSAPSSVLPGEEDVSPAVPSSPVRSTGGGRPGVTAQRLARALRRCHSQTGLRRHRCEAAARRRYRGTVSRTKALRPR
jgi:hypothetical protein